MVAAIAKELLTIGCKSNSVEETDAPRPNRLRFFCTGRQKHRRVRVIIVLGRVVKISSRGEKNPAALGIVSHRSKLNSLRSAGQFFARSSSRIAAPGGARCCD